jgi:hypothetical protein
MHSDWFNGIDKLQGRWQHGEKVGYCYTSRFERTLCKWEVYVPLVTKGLNNKRFYNWVCIWLVILFEDLKMHGTTNHKD